MISNMLLHSKGYCFLHRIVEHGIHVVLIGERVTWIATIDLSSHENTGRIAKTRPERGMNVLSRVNTETIDYCRRSQLESGKSRASTPSVDGRVRDNAYLSSPIQFV